MKGTIQVLGVLAAAKSVSATYNWFEKPTYNLPYQNQEECAPDQYKVWDFDDVDVGDIKDYKNFFFGNYKIEESQYTKRSGRGKGRKCASTYVEQESYTNEIKCDKKFTVDEYDVSVDEPSTLEFTYGMPDGSNCKQVTKCGKGVTAVKNTQCGGAKSVKCRIHKSSPSKKKCKFNIHNIKFKCKDKNPPPPAQCYGNNCPPASCEPGSYGCPATQPTDVPTDVPSCEPGSYGCPATQPTDVPTDVPSCEPGSYGCPVTQPTDVPTDVPSCEPGSYGCPATQPTDVPTTTACVPGSYGCPETQPTDVPTDVPSCEPGSYGCPVTQPTDVPTDAPSCEPGSYGCPATQPTDVPTGVPSCEPGSYGCPATQPTDVPTDVPSCEPGSYGCPATQPTDVPTNVPSCEPGSYGCPATQPTDVPTDVPSCEPGSYGCPATEPTSVPTDVPACEPGSYGCPATQPTDVPTYVPTDVPSCEPGSYGCPATQPTDVPTDVPACEPGSYGCPAPTSEPYVPPVPTYVPPVNNTIPTGVPTYETLPPYQTDSLVTDTPSETTDYAPIPSVPVETGCPQVLPKCMTAWTSITQCIDSGDVGCLCPNADYINSVAGCVEAYGVDDDEVAKALEYLQGLCAEKIPENPAIVTCVPTYVTLPPVTSGASTVTISTTVVVPCTSCPTPVETTAGYEPVYVTETIATTVTVCPVKLVTTEPSKPVLVPGTVTAPPYVPPSSVPATIPAQPTEYYPTTMATLYPTAPAAANTTGSNPPIATGAASSLGVFTSLMAAGMVGVVALIMA